MLKKLLKHEWIATGRRYGMFYLILAAVTLFTALIRLIDVESNVVAGLQGIFTGIYIITLIGVWFCSVGMAVIRFYKNMVTDEGYLTFTLPAKVEQLVGAKLIVALVWQVITIAALVLSVSSMFLFGKVSWDEIQMFVRMFESELKMPLAVFAIMMAVSLVYQMLVYYLSIAIGQLFAGNKIAGSIVGYLIISFALELAIVGIVFVSGFIAGFAEMDLLMATEKGMTIYMCLLCGMMLLVAVGAYFLTCNLLKKKLNLT